MPEKNNKEDPATLHWSGQFGGMAHIVRGRQHTAESCTGSKGETAPRSPFLTIGERVMVAVILALLTESMRIGS